MQEHWEQPDRRCAATTVGEGHGQFEECQRHWERTGRLPSKRVVKHDTAAIPVSCLLKSSLHAYCRPRALPNIVGSGGHRSQPKFMPHADNTAVSVLCM